MARFKNHDLAVLEKVARSRHYRLRMAGIRNIEKNELVNAGYIGFAEAKTTFDAEKSPSFEAYAAMKINFAITQFLRNLDPIDHRLRAQIESLKRSKEKHFAEHGRYPRPGELAETLDSTPKKMEELSNILTAVEGIKNAQEIMDYISYSQEMQDIDSVLLFRETDKCIKTMKNDTPIKLLVLHRIKGFTAKECAKTIGKKYTATQFSRIIKSAIKILINCLAGKGWTVRDIEETIG